jgi:septation ring formation regulator EzrA
MDMTQINMAGQKYTEAANSLEKRIADIESQIASFNVAQSDDAVANRYQYVELKKHILDNERLIGLQMVEIEKLKNDVTELKQLNDWEVI